MPDVRRWLWAVYSGVACRTACGRPCRPVRDRRWRRPMA